MSREPVTTKRIDSQQSFHPQFDDATADTVLSSNQGTLFRMHSVTLRATSGLLRLFLSDPKPTNTGGDPASPPDLTNLSLTTTVDMSTDVISLPFDDVPIQRVLLLVSAQPTEPWSSFEELEAAINVMEYLDTPGPLTFVRASCFMPVFSSQPIRLYGLGSKFGWNEVTEHAAVLTLSLNLLPSSTSDDNQNLEEQLTRLSSGALYKLLKFHRLRRDTFRNLMYSVEIFGVGNATQINCPCGTEVNNSCWRELRARLVWETDQNPSGATILSPEMEEMEESAKCWKAKCSRCGSLYYNRIETLKNIRSCVGKLPQAP
ncbi:hypothetical protein NP233_g5875 [Leucocoprinus birnbaumii]|uniref:BTB domain-containing protein n=1 Tax=Leucocoprinus birnbaumii TaxID=56174 RepID=A0AAD5YU67_9AGAR|nr:hypothetical protein NP233_g5875 [Leucocoprinus birnbaumii]